MAVGGVDIRKPWAQAERRDIPTKHTVNPSPDARDARNAVDALLTNATEAGERGEWELAGGLAKSAAALTEFC